MAITKHFTIEQGTTFRKRLALKIIANDVKVPIDLTGQLFAGHIRPQYDGPLQMSFRFVDQVDAEGRVDMVLEASDTASMPAGQYVYDVERSFLHPGTGIRQVRRILKGRIVIEPEVTRNV